ncbi:MAG: hypothetical protein HY811_03370 [Planctomycetes bacterium]|nr:hypothetical protein [Planctomycetota bacterium]
MRKLTLLLMVSIGAVLMSLSVKTVYLHSEGADADDKKLACDMKPNEMVVYCEKCTKFLKCYSCAQCKKQFDKEQKEKKSEVSGKPSYMFFEDEVTFGKCPTCSGKLTATELLDKNGKCILCGDKPKKQKTCIKSVYACLDHSEQEFLSAGKCSVEVKDKDDKPKKCGKGFVVKYISRAKIVMAYMCICGDSQPVAPQANTKCAKCGADNASRTGTLVCEKSKEFPHVNPKEWEKKNK